MLTRVFYLLSLFAELVSGVELYFLLTIHIRKLLKLLEKLWFCSCIDD